MRALPLLLLVWSCSNPFDEEPWRGTGGGTLVGDDGADGTDGTDGTDDTDGTDGTDGTDDSGATDGTDDSGAADGTDGTAPAELGTIAGDCGLLDSAELSSADPFYFDNVLDLGDAGYAYDLLSAGGQEVIDDGNLGGSSLESEAVAFDVLHRCEGAVLLKTEGEIVYDDPDSKKTDLLVELDGLKIGVSVTRAVGWPREDPWTVEQAEALLEDKLADIPLASAAVSDEDRWSKQVLAVVAWSPDHAAAAETAWLSLDPALTLDTVVYVTATDGSDDALYE